MPRAIILDFVDPEQIDDRFFDTPYYLTPGKGADRAYALLRDAIRRTGRIGIAKFILRDAQHLAAVEVIGEALVLTMMRFASELVDVKGRKPALDTAERPQDAEVIDLMERLQQSLAQRKGGGSRTPASQTRTVGKKKKGRAA